MKFSTHLSDWMSRTHTTSEELARVMTRVRGYPCYAAHVRRWRGGARVPGVITQQQIERATDGVVRVEGWS